MSAAAAPAEVAWRPRVNPWLVAPAVMLATFMEVLDTSIASVALPYIAGNMGATPDEATWVLTSYLVSNAIVLPASGWFSRYFGRKRFLIACIIIFSASSFMCGASRSLMMLIIARVAQGAGGGALQPLSQSIMLESFPPAKRGTAMAVYGVGVVCAPILGPTLGGWLTDNWSWRWAFYINIPVSILAVFLISIFVEDPPYIRQARPGRIDSIGFGLMAIGLACLQIVLDKGQEADWFGSLWIRWMTAISAASLIAFIIWELYTTDPIVHLRVFRNWNFAVGCCLFLLFGAAVYGMITLQPLFLQTLLGYPAWDAGLTVSPRGAGALAALFLVGALIERMGGRKLAAGGFIFFSISAWMLSDLTLSVSMSNIIPANLINGFGTGFVFVPLTTVNLGTLPSEEIGNAAGIQNLVRNMGGSAGISFVSTMLERYSQAHQAFMTARVSSLSWIYHQRIATLDSFLSTHFGLANAGIRAQQMIYDSINQQTRYWAFITLFRWFMWMGIGCAVAVWFLKKTRSHPSAVAAH